MSKPIIIHGESGSGKTTRAKLIAQKYRNPIWIDGRLPDPFYNIMIDENTDLIIIEDTPNKKLKDFTDLFSNNFLRIPRMFTEDLEIKMPQIIIVLNNEIDIKSFNSCWLDVFKMIRMVKCNDEPMILEYHFEIDNVPVEFIVDTSKFTKKDALWCVCHHNWDIDGEDCPIDEVVKIYALKSLGLATIKSCGVAGVIKEFEKKEGYFPIDGSRGIELIYVEPFMFNNLNLKINQKNSKNEILRKPYKSSFDDF